MVIDPSLSIYTGGCKGKREAVETRGRTPAPWPKKQVRVEAEGEVKKVTEVENR